MFSFKTPLPLPRFALLIRLPAWRLRVTATCSESAAVEGWEIKASEVAVGEEVGEEQVRRGARAPGPGGAPAGHA